MVISCNENKFRISRSLQYVFKRLYAGYVIIVAGRNTVGIGKRIALVHPGR